ncbi:hypothetical protein PR048_001271 [Dryococelus australis]|uniref:Uncharacterized protein n=1 Tax=Dryococelus australis TaxID=614101 RepID=A0ABQ9IID2_9NEOP|nr:hypothetical protein PR048_001271 [Dryococelus australis]
MFLTELVFEVQHCPGKSNDLPEALSCQPDLEDKEWERMTPPQLADCSPEAASCNLFSHYRRIVKQKIKSDKLNKSILITI